MIREASARDASGLVWFKSSYSDSNNPNDCVEVANTPATIHIRDSKQTDGPRLRVAPGAWTEFLGYAAGH
ncbi:DUF397 domain-containing protein [Streptomyces roseochromogenus]|uniref:DUF397 domain-containing protein n=1 Tax=Streptomyces roseochromogenus subsp. oscitans DS 12.976 TaxID=1352936 RepID=V6K8R2_STRRC|nr:DUF397 domain-containing protein [Streptomyces roseochromogenus]EST27796.1 hypothetical protein M878_24045 [Streptomyces roseochromogenus subsp. oscitans DS 12.976]